MIAYEPPEQRLVRIGEHIDGLGTVLEPDDVDMTATEKTRESCRWAQTGDELEMDVSTSCGHYMMEYEGDEQHWELRDGDKCPFCGRPIQREWGWL